MSTHRVGTNAVGKQRTIVKHRGRETCVDTDADTDIKIDRQRRGEKVMLSRYGYVKQNLCMTQKSIATGSEPMIERRARQ